MRENCCDGLIGYLPPDLFKALSDPSRIAILARMATACREQTVSEVADCCPVDLSVVSRHLRTLREAGVLASEKRGKAVYYQVRFHEVAALLRNLADALEACCAPGTQKSGR
jgi:ArsR family transcriptional regulator